MSTGHGLPEGWEQALDAELAGLEDDTARLRRLAARPAPRPVPVKRRLYKMTVRGPSTDNVPTAEVRGLVVGDLIVLLLMLQERDVATIECTESDDT